MYISSVRQTKPAEYWIYTCDACDLIDPNEISERGNMSSVRPSEVLEERERERERERYNKKRFNAYFFSSHRLHLLNIHEKMVY